MNLRRAFFVKIVSSAFVSLLVLGSLNAAADRSGARPWQPLFDAVKSDFKEIYALEGYKRARFGWDRELEFDRLLANLIDLGPNPSRSGVQYDFRRMFQNTRDYHTGIYFKSDWAESTLPFGIRTLDRHAYVTFVDRKEWPSETFPVGVGDELVRIDGVSVTNALAKLLRKPIASLRTDLSYADRYLTRRPGYEGFRLPSGGVTLEFIRKDGRRATIDWEWKKVPNLVTKRVLRPASSRRGEVPEQLEAKIDRAHFILNEPKVSPTPNFDAVNAIGNRYPFVPQIGTNLWRSERDAHFFAEIGRTENGTRVGFIRIATYFPAKPREAIAEFDALIGRMQASTDVLILDQTNNGGGSVLYFYELLSHLITHPVPATLRFRWSLQPMNFHIGMKWTELETKLSQVHSDAEARAVLGNDLNGYPVDLRTARGALAEARAVLADMRVGGSRLSRSMPLLTIDRIEPKGHVYRKPIIMLQNEFSFSCADMAPAILQDLRRARIFGTQAPGLGAYVISREAPPNDPFGVWLYRLSMAEVRRGGERGEPIENNGVKPDFFYGLQPIDFKEYFRGYREALVRYAENLALSPVAEETEK